MFTTLVLRAQCSAAHLDLLLEPPVTAVIDSFRYRRSFSFPVSVKCFDLQLERRHEQMKRNLEAQYKELEEKRRVFEEEKANWEAQQRILEQQKLDASK